MGVVKWWWWQSSCGDDRYCSVGYSDCHSFVIIKCICGGGGASGGGGVVVVVLME